MSTRTFALVFVIVFLVAAASVVAAASGFIPGMLHPVRAGAAALTVPTGYGLVMGLPPVDLLRNLVHLKWMT